MGYLSYLSSYNRTIGLMSKVFNNSLPDQSSIQKMVLDVSVLKTQHYKVWNKGEVGQFREWSSALPYT